MAQNSRDRTDIKNASKGYGSVSTRSKTKPDRDKKKQEEADAARKKAKLIAVMRAREIEARPAAKPGTRDDVNFHAAFIQMGQGDCTIMCTPKGRIVMVDCGSDSYREVIRDEEELPEAGEEESEGDREALRRVISGTLKHEKFLKGSNTVDLLILTHPDADHYNKLSAVMDDSVEFLKVYHSKKRGAYAKGATSEWILNHAADENLIFEVDHHENGGEQVIALNGEAVPARDEDEDPPEGGVLDGKGGILILDEPNCKISLLSGNVNTTTHKDHSTPANRGSLVVLIELFGKKRLLMSGDATLNTEQYVVDYHSARIKGVDLATASHHASDNTSSLPAYVTAVKPKQLLVSAGKQIKMHHLPSEAVINRYADAMTAAVKIPEHTVYFWSKGKLNSYFPESEKTTLPIYITGSRGTWQYSILAKDNK
ncbi:ComEC/Rec2 family competence protein [Streptosporangium sp. NPDC002721]|uniref:ComEC/Rec2 family competence protein n=1 Tax=Streptosporangium sp. NPDC002721 TaxID=3366188 RepID=UPI00369EEC31